MDLFPLLAQHITAVLDAIASALIAVIGAVETHATALAGLVFVALGAWVHRRLGIDQDAALMAGMRTVERDHVAAKAVGAPAVPGEARRAAASGEADDSDRASNCAAGVQAPPKSIDHRRTAN